MQSFGLTSCGGTLLFKLGTALVSCTMHLIQNQRSYTDASGNWGCGAIFDTQWLQWQWPDEWKQAGIMYKELVPILLSCVVWGSTLSKKCVRFYSDNLSLVDSLNKGSSKDPSVMKLLRTLWLLLHSSTSPPKLHIYQEYRTTLLFTCPGII